MSSLGAHDLVGTWRLVGARARDADGNTLPPPYGGTGIGVVTIDACGRMVTVVCQGDTAPGEAREYSSYCGQWRVDGDTLVCQVDASADPGRVGGEQIRRVNLEGGRMTLYPPPRPWRGLMQHRELVWEKIA